MEPECLSLGLGLGRASGPECLGLRPPSLGLRPPSLECLGLGLRASAVGLRAWASGLGLQPSCLGLGLGLRAVVPGPSSLECLGLWAWGPPGGG